MNKSNRKIQSSQLVKRVPYQPIELRIKYVVARDKQSLKNKNLQYSSRNCEGQDSRQDKIQAKRAALLAGNRLRACNKKLIELTNKQAKGYIKQSRTISTKSNKIISEMSPIKHYLNKFRQQRDQKPPLSSKSDKKHLTHALPRRANLSCHLQIEQIMMGHMKL